MITYIYLCLRDVDYCPQLYMTLTSLNWFTSVFTLTVLSVDRYCAVCHAVGSMRYRTEFVARLVCFGVWAVSLLAVSPVIIYTTEMTDPSSGLASCELRLPVWEDDEITTYRVFILYVFVLAFIVPVVMISLFYSLVVVRLRRVGPNKRTNIKKR